MISIEPWLIILTFVVYGVLVFLAVKSRTRRRTWKILFWSSLSIPVVVCILAYLMIAAGASSYSDPTRTEIQAFGFIIAIFIGIGVLVLCMPGWIILGIKAFKGNDDIRTEESSKEEHIIEDISREEAVERMKERYRQDAERGNEQGE